MMPEFGSCKTVSLTTLACGARSSDPDPVLTGWPVREDAPSVWPPRVPAGPEGWRGGIRCGSGALPPRESRERAHADSAETMVDDAPKGPPDLDARLGQAPHEPAVLPLGAPCLVKIWCPEVVEMEVQPSATNPADNARTLDTKSKLRRRDDDIIITDTILRHSTSFHRRSARALCTLDVCQPGTPTRETTPASNDLADLRARDVAGELACLMDFAPTPRRGRRELPQARSDPSHNLSALTHFASPPRAPRRELSFLTPLLTTSGAPA